MKKWCIEAKISLVLAFLVLAMSVWIGLAGAEVNIIDNLKKIPALNQAVIFSLDDNTFNYATTITCVSFFNEKIKLDIGYTPAQELIGAVSFKLVEMKNYIKFPILDLITIEPFVYIGWDRISGINANQKGNSEFDKGFGVKLLAVKF